MIFNLTKIYGSAYGFYQGASSFFSDLFGLVYIKAYSSVSLFFIVCNWVLAYFINIKSSGDSIIFLHYNVDFGANLIGEVGKIYVIPLLGVIIFLFNFILSARLYKQNKFIPHVLMSSGLVVNISLLISLYLLYLINFK